MSPASSSGSTFVKSSGVEVLDVEEQLQVARRVADRREHGLAHAALGDRRGRRRAASRRRSGVDALLLAGRLGRLRRSRSACGRAASVVRRADVVAIRIGAGGAERRRLRTPLADDAVERVDSGVLGHGGGPYHLCYHARHASVRPRRRALPLACKGSRHEQPQPEPARPPPAPDACAKAVAEGQIAWIEDDYAGALACAKQKKHPARRSICGRRGATRACRCRRRCSRIRRSRASSDKFVLASLDTDREENAAALEQVRALGVADVLRDRRGREPCSRGLSARRASQQFHEFLDCGLRALTGGTRPADARLLGAERALAKKDLRRPRMPS